MIKINNVVTARFIRLVDYKVTNHRMLLSFPQIQVNFLSMISLKIRIFAV